MHKDAAHAERFMLNAGPFGWMSKPLTNGDEFNKLLTSICLGL